MDKVRSRLLVTLAVAVVAGGAGEAIQRLLVEPRMSGPIGAFMAFSSLLPLVVAGVMAGLAAGTLVNGLIHGVGMAVAVVGTRVALSWALGLPYSHDVWLSSPDFVKALLLEVVLLSALLVFIVECTILSRSFARRLRLGV